MLPLIKGAQKSGSQQEEGEKKERRVERRVWSSEVAVVGLAAENLSSTRRLGPTQLGGPDRQSPSVSAEAENQAPAPTTPDSAPFSRRPSDRGSFPISHKTNSSVSLRGLLPVSPPPFSSGRRLNAAAAPPSRIFFCPREKRTPRRSQNRPHIGEDSPKFYLIQAPLRSTIQLSSPHVEISIVLWRSFRIREKRYLLPTKADPPPRSLPPSNT